MKEGFRSVQIPEEAKRVVDEWNFLVESRGDGATRSRMMYWNLLRNKLNAHTPRVGRHGRTQCEAIE